MSSFLAELKKIIIVYVSMILLFCLSIFLFGGGNCISGAIIRSGFNIANILHFVSWFFFAICGFLIFKFVNKNKKANPVGSFIQIMLLQKMIYTYEFADYDPINTFKMCKSNMEYSMFAVMVVAFVLQLFLCILDYKNRVKQGEIKNENQNEIKD